MFTRKSITCFPHGELVAGKKIGMGAIWGSPTMATDGRGELGEAVSKVSGFPCPCPVASAAWFMRCEKVRGDGRK
jgi:hypothetical protein